MLGCVWGTLILCTPFIRLWWLQNVEIPHDAVFSQILKEVNIRRVLASEYTLSEYLNRGKLGANTERDSVCVCVRLRKFLLNHTRRYSNYLNFKDIF